MHAHDSALHQELYCKPRLAGQPERPQLHRFGPLLRPQGARQAYGVPYTGKGNEFVRVTFRPAAKRADFSDMGAF